MKKVKIMLFSLALLAVVGAALAFKAKFNTAYCISTYDPLQPNAPATCSTLFTTSTTFNGITTYWTTTAATTIVNNQVKFTCSTLNPIGELTYLSCEITTKLTSDN